MANASITIDALGRRRRRGPQPRRRIALPDGDYLEPRAALADALGVSDRTAARMNLPTTYFGNVAYVAHGASMAIIAAGVRRPNQPEPTPKRRRAR
jgi:hypothetical protein